MSAERTGERSFLFSPQLDEEIWQERFSRYFDDLPEPPQGEAVFRFIDATDFEADRPRDCDIGGVVYYCQETGRMLRIFEVFISLRQQRRRGGEIIEFEYEPIKYKHPINGQEFKAEVVEMRRWLANRQWQRKSGVECGRQVVVLDEGWSPDLNRPRGSLTLEDGSYEHVGLGVWRECMRGIFDGKETYIFFRDDSGLMVYVPLESINAAILQPATRLDVRESPKTSELVAPGNLGKARYLGFHK